MDLINTVSQSNNKKEYVLYCKDLKKSQFVQCKMILDGLKLLINFEDDKEKLEINILTSIFIHNNVNKDAYILEVLFKSQIYIKFESNSRREDWFYSLKSAQVNYDNLIFHCFHKWTRNKNPSNIREHNCIACHQRLTPNFPIVYCTICQIYIHDGDLGDFKGSCKWIKIDSADKKENENKVLAGPHQWVPEYNLHSPCKLCGDSSYSPNNCCLKCVWCFARRHDICQIKGNCSCDLNSTLAIPPSYIESVENGSIQLAKIPNDYWPTFVFINVRSGKCLGLEFSTEFKRILNPIQVWELPLSSPSKCLLAIKNLPRARIVICGGDGTINWILNEIDKIEISPYNIQIFPIPLGTGNDLSRVFGWGGSFDSVNRISFRLFWQHYTISVPFDRWKVSIREFIPTSTNDDTIISLTKCSKEENIKYIFALIEVLRLQIYKLSSHNNITDVKATLKEIYSLMTNFIQKVRKITEVSPLNNQSYDTLSFSNLDEKLHKLNFYLGAVKNEFVSKKPSKNLHETRIISLRKPHSSAILNDKRYSLGSFNQRSFNESEIFSPELVKKYFKNDQMIFILHDIKSLIYAIAAILYGFQGIRSLPLITESPSINWLKESPESNSKNVVSFFNETTLISQNYLQMNHIFSNDPSKDVDNCLRNSKPSPTSVDNVMNNYFGIGVDAKIALDFHIKREDSPHKFGNRLVNKIYYGLIGGKEMLTPTLKDFCKYITIECDGIPIKIANIQGIIVLNIPSYMSGINFWGSSCDGFNPQSLSDKLLEVMAVEDVKQLSKARVVGSGFKEHRIAQCRSVKITITGISIPVQIDGEAFLQKPGIINITYKNSMFMLKRSLNLKRSKRNNVYDIDDFFPPLNIKSLSDQARIKRISSDLDALCKMMIPIMPNFIEIKQKIGTLNNYILNARSKSIATVDDFDDMKNILTFIYGYADILRNINFTTHSIIQQNNILEFTNNSKIYNKKVKESLLVYMEHFDNFLMELFSYIKQMQK